jgi:hypothetical protein
LLKLTVIKYMPYMFANIGFTGLKQIDHLSLREPGGFVFHPHVDAGLPVIALIYDNFRFFREHTFTSFNG